MILRSIIVDDEYKGISTLKAIIEEYIPDVSVVAVTTSASEAINMVRDYRPEIVFLDINMPEMSGFEFLDRLSWKNFNLVFTTAHQEYALAALKKNAVDYILKPIDHEDVQAAITKIRKQMSENENNVSLINYTQLVKELGNSAKNKMLISLKTGIEAIDLAEIIYLESSSNYTSIHLNNGRIISTSKTLKEFEDQLCNNKLGFMRVHHSFIININRVVKYLRSDEIIILDNEQKIPLSKSKRDAFYSWLSI